jgi:two-component system NtrC family sensor kinase
MRILLVADTPEGAESLRALLEPAGYTTILAEDFTAPPPCDVVLADVTRFRFSPFAGLQAQRRMGSNAAAILISTRLTDQMATEMFGLGIRDFILRPIGNDALLERLTAFFQHMQQEKEHLEISQRLEKTESALARRLEEINTLSRIGRAIASLSDIDVMLSHIVDAGVYLTHAEEGAIFLVDEASGALVLRAQRGLGDQQAEAIRRPSTDSDVMEVLRTGLPIQKAADDEHKVKTGFLVRALINVPIIIGSTTVGVVATYNHGTRSFASGDQQVLANLADFAAVALDKVRSIQAVEDRVDDALASAREIQLHAETLISPIEGIESLTDTLLSGGFGSLGEQQHDAVTRIKQATTRLREIVEFIEQALAKSEHESAAQ